jgi:excisionase family DNA binding protein
MTEATGLTRPEILDLVERAVQRAMEQRPRPASVTQKQAAEMLNLSEPTISRMIRANQIRLNGIGRVPVSEIDRVLSVR